MDRIETVQPAQHDAADSPAPAARPQSRIPPLLLAVLAATIVLRIVVSAGERGRQETAVGLVGWQTSEQAPAAAKRSQKILLYDFTAAWCVPCHRLDSEGWGDPSIAAAVNRSFVASRVIDREREDGKNSDATERLQQRYSISAFPTLVAADASGREIARMEGYGGKDRLADFLQEAKKKAGAP